jgi:hypothetical protein
MGQRPITWFRLDFTDGERQAQRTWGCNRIEDGSNLEIRSNAKHQKMLTLMNITFSGRDLRFRANQDSMDDNLTVDIPEVNNPLCHSDFKPGLGSRVDFSRFIFRSPISKMRDHTQGTLVEGMLNTQNTTDTAKAGEEHLIE